MILILSTRNEPSTDAVVDHLLYNDVHFIRLNSEDITDRKGYLEINIDNNVWHIGNLIIELDKIRVVWYRRWNNFELNLSLKSKFRDQITQEVYSELNELSRYLFLTLQNAFFLSNPLSVLNHNKLYTLALASSCGLTIPDTSITNNNKFIRDKIDSKGYITKPIADSHAFDDNAGNIYKVFTDPISASQLDIMEETFLPSLFQACVNSSFEIRTFFLDNIFYSTAILNSGTLDVKQSVGFNAETVKMVPFKLPSAVEEKLKLLMEKLNLNCGAIDLIKSSNDVYYFLEVNPIGQFLGYSEACNYKLEVKIASWLIAHNYEEN